MPIEIEVGVERGRWRFSRIGSCEIWLTGHLLCMSDPDFYLAAASAVHLRSEELDRWLSSIRGHFAFVVRSDGLTLAAVDQVRSIPLFYGSVKSLTVVGPDVQKVTERLNLSSTDYDSGAILSWAMAGYTTGRSTILRQLYQLRAGETFIAPANAETFEIRRYSCYAPWLVQQNSEEDFLGQLKQVSTELLQTLANSVGDRPIVVPLSAGLDSRMIVSGLVEVGFCNIKCFAYGRPGNFEVAASQRIADALGLPWTFVPFRHKDQAELFRSDLWAEYQRFSNGLSATPFAQDFLAIKTLREVEWLPPDAVIVNGNTGDFISGGHVPSGLPADPSATSDERERQLLMSLVSRHFRLWNDLAGPRNDELVMELIRQEWRSAGLQAGNPEVDHALFEFTEFQDRQAKYVINGQRAYDFFDIEWRLPLWDSPFMRFWETVPRHLKTGQSLYRRFLFQENWGGVWAGWDFPKPKPSGWLRPLMLGARAASLAFGRDWMPIERRYFAYWFEVLNNYAVVPYSRVVLDGRGARNAIAWHTLAFFESADLPWPEPSR